MPADTKTSILDTAERLFAERGYASTSLRTITSAARVNLAAIHYHFRSKDALLEAVVARRADAVNSRRLEILNQLRKKAGGRPLTLEQIFEAFLGPAFEMARNLGEAGARFARLMGRLYAEGDMPHQIIRNKFGPVIEVFQSALHEAQPDLPSADLRWRIHFFIGAMAHTLRWSQLGDVIPGGEPSARGEPFDSAKVLRRLIVFLAAGFRAPASSSSGGSHRK